MQVITKNKMESMCRTAGLVPVARRTVDGREVFIADGKSATPERTFSKFGVEANDFPGGCYATMYFVSRREDKLDIGHIMFFDLFHNPELAHEAKQQARINTAVDHAKALLTRLKSKAH